MKRIIFLLLSVIMTAQIFSQDIVNIPDTKFLAALLEKGVDTIEISKLYTLGSLSCPIGEGAVGYPNGIYYLKIRSYKWIVTRRVLKI